MKPREGLPDHCLSGGGEMGALMRARDWSATPLGPVELWPQSLRTLVGTILASSIPMVIFWGRDYIQLYNDGYVPIFGHGKHPQALGASGRESWAEVWEYVGPRFDRVMDTAVTSSSEDQLFLLDRRGFIEECYFTFSYSPVRDESGRVAGVLSTCVETTHRVIGERRLETLRALSALPARCTRWSEVVDGAVEALGANVHDFCFSALYLRDDDDSYVPASGSPVQPGLLPPKLRPGDDVDALAVLFERAGETGRLLVTDAEGGLAQRAPAGVWNVPVRKIAVAPLAIAGQPGYAGFLVAGLSPRLAADEAYLGFIDTAAASIVAALNHARAVEDEAQRVKALEDLDRLKTEFFSNISHEFRTPITLMLGPAELLLRDEAGALPDEARRQVDGIYRNSRRLLKLVNALLDFSRIEAGRAQGSFQPTDLPRLTSDLASMFRAAIERAGLQLVIDCPPLPSPIYVDREMWEKIVLNLLSNALKFTFEGNVRIALELRHQEAVLTVADSGVGIPAADLPRVFDRFHRIRGMRSRTHEGSGIGLSLVYELARLHRGRAWVDSREGRGTTVQVAIPVGRAHLPAGQVREHGEQHAAGRGSAFVEEAMRWLPAAADGVANGVLDDLPSNVPGPGACRGRILVADDNADLRDYLRQLLASHYQVELAADGTAALAAATASPPDLVLADVMMPGLDGLELLRALKSDPRTIAVPVILLSARAGEESRIEGVAAGADDYLVKPFSARELLARIDVRLELARLRRSSDQREHALLTELKSEKSRVEAILASINDAFAVFDADWRYTYVNDATVRMARRTREQLIGNVIWDCFPDLRGTVFEAEMLRVARDGVAARFEFCHQRSRRWFDVRLNTVAGGVSVLGTEITERKQAEAFLLDARAALEAQVAERTADLAESNRTLSQEVAERRRVERALRASEERFRKAFDDAAVGMAITDRAARFLAVNAAYERLSGRAGEDLQALDILGLTHPEDRVETLRRVRRLLDGEAGSCVIEKRYLQPDGRVVWTQDSMAVVRDDQGEPSNLIVLSEDITVRKRAEGALRASEERFRSLTELSSDWYWEQDRNFRFTYLSAGFQKVTGVSPDAVLGRTRWEQPVYGISEERWRQHRQQLEARKRFSDLEYGFCLPGGERRWGRVSGEPVFDADGEFLGYRGVTIDLTERRLAEEMLHERERLLQGVLDALPVGVWIADRDGNIVHGNPAGRRIWAGERLVGVENYGEYKGWWAGTDRPIEPRDWALARAIERGETSIDELVDIQCFDGSRRTILNSAVPLRDDSGAVTGAIVVNEDVTQRKLVEETVANIAAGMSAATGEAFFQSLVARLGATLAMDCAFIGEVVDDGAAAIRVIASSGSMSLKPGDSYRLADTPCENVVMRGACIYEDNVDAQFPRDVWLHDMGIRSYAGTPLRDSAGDVLGILTVVGSRPLANAEMTGGVLNIVAARATSELERSRNDTTIRMLMQASQRLHAVGAVQPLARRLAEAAVDVSGARGARVALHASAGRFSSDGEYLEGAWHDHPLDCGEPEALVGANPGELVSCDGVASRRGERVTLVPLNASAGGLLGFIELIGTPGHGKLPRVIRERLLGLVQIGALAAEKALSMERVQGAEKHLRESESRLRALAARLQHMLEEERTRIAREIHDVLGQALTGLKLDVAWVKRAVPADRDDALEQIESIGKSLDTIVQTVRRIASDLRPGELDDLGLVAAIESAAQEFQSRTGIRCRARLPELDVRVDTDTATALFRICQELLTNVVRHARARHVSLSLETLDDSLVLTVADDGRGMSAEQQAGRRSLGLMGIRERTLMFGGSVAFDSAPGAGTRAVVRMPLAQPGAAGSDG
jgi:PAS domain S-box-containing protein